MFCFLVKNTGNISSVMQLYQTEKNYVLCKPLCACHLINLRCRTVLLIFSKYIKLDTFYSARCNRKPQ